jgi:hypothetical protein
MRCDLRAMPMPSRRFGLVASFFTGFGYLERPSDDLSQLAELARLVAPGGWLHLDLPDPEAVRGSLVPRDCRRWDDAWVEQVRTLEDDRVVKRIRIRRDDGTVSEYVEKVRLWNPDVLERCASDLGLVARLRLGDLTGSDWKPGDARCGLCLRRERA